MFHLDGQIGFNAGQCRQDVIQNLFRRHPERPAPRTDLQPARLVAVIALGEILGANQDGVGVIGQFHVTLNSEVGSKAALSGNANLPIGSFSSLKFRLF